VTTNQRPDGQAEICAFRQQAVVTGHSMQSWKLTASTNAVCSCLSPTNLGPRGCPMTLLQNGIGNNHNEGSAASSSDIDRNQMTHIPRAQAP